MTEDIAKRASGRSITDFWLDAEEGISDPHNPPRYGNEQRLHPAEWRLLDCAENGLVAEIAKKRPSAASDSNLIRASFLRFMALGGDAQHPLHDRGVFVVGAFVDGQVDLNGCTLAQKLIFARCHFNGELNFRHSRLESVFFQECRLSTFFGDGLETTGDFNLRAGTLATGTVRLLGASIGGDLDCSGSRFEGSDVSLFCDGMVVKGRVFLNDQFMASLTVRLLGARIGGNLESRNGRFLDKNLSLDAETASIEGALFLDHGFLALGSVNLTNVQVGTSLSFLHGTFSAKEKSIHAPNIKVGNSVYLSEECRVRGEISLQSAQIGDSITFVGGSFETKGQINLRNAKIGNMLTWRQVAYMRGELNLAGASCRSLNMDEVAWTQPSQIRLDNFAYGRFAELPDGCNPAFWKRWLEKQPQKHLEQRFRPSSYQQLAKVLEAMGHEEEAREVRIERRERQRLFSLHHVPMPASDFRKGVRHLANFWRWVEKKVIGHGYRPGFAVLWLVLVIGLGGAIYQWAAIKGIMTPTHPLIFKAAIWEGAPGQTPEGKLPVACRENWVYPKDSIGDICAAAIASEYSTFNALIYSADTAIPVVNFRMEDDWAPRVVDWQSGQRSWSGWWVRTWEWFQIGVGWALSLLFVSAIGGVIRKE